MPAKNNLVLDQLVKLIPQKINPTDKKSFKDFSRNSKLPFPKLITFILSISASGKSKGVDSKSGDFFKSADRSGLWLNSKAIHRSTLTKARAKVEWEVFRDIFYNAVNLAYKLYPQSKDFLWHGMSVIAFDGSKVRLPATDEIREEFDPNSGLENKCKGHYPQCLVSTAYDVFRRIPIARTIVGILEACERTEVKRMLPYIPEGNVLLFDRGYPSYDLIQYLNINYMGSYLFRCVATHTFPAIEAFIKSRKSEAIIWLDPTNKFKSKIKQKDRASLKPIKIRVIKLISPDGTVSVLLTNLFDKKEYSVKEITSLYFKRWGVETYYHDEKVVLEVEKFHCKTVNGIRQELFAIAIMSVIARLLMTIPAEQMPDNIEPQFKNTVMSFAAEAALLVPTNPEISVTIFNELLTEIARVKYYKPKISRSSNPRVSKKPLNKWVIGKQKALQLKT